MSGLAARLAAQIAATGPLTVAQYMAECLTHPDFGYYTGRDPLGAQGDFTTSPEISQMFGELMGLCVAQAWLDRGSPAPFTLLELGPGRGTLMADALRATAGVPGFHDAARLHLLEISPTLRERQAQALADRAPRWIESLGDLPEDTPLFTVANEYFDALPIRQFVRGETSWRERVIGLDESGELTFGLGPETRLSALDHRLDDTQAGELVETCAPAARDAEELARRIAASGGCAIAIDYGGWRSRGDTLQAVRAHRYEPVLAAPGAADLTAHVDFEALAAAAAGVGACVAPMTTQGVFLERLGITARARQLAQSLSGPQLESHIAAHRRLTHPAEMGDLFKVLAIYRRDDPPPPGCDT